jgi:hypothetical protein
MKKLILILTMFLMPVVCQADSRIPGILTVSGEVVKNSITVESGYYYGDGSKLINLTGGTASSAAYATLSGTATYAALSANASNAAYSTLSGQASQSAYSVISGTSTNAGAAVYAILAGTASNAASGLTSIASQGAVPLQGTVEVVAGAGTSVSQSGSNIVINLIGNGQASNAGGSNGQVQYNSNEIVAGASGLTYEASTGTTYVSAEVLIGTMTGDAFCIMFELPSTAYAATNVDRVVIGRAIHASSVILTADTKPVGASILVDVNKNGTSIFPNQGLRAYLASNEATRTATADSVFVPGDILSWDIDQTGTATMEAGGNFLMMTLAGRKR